MKLKYILLFLIILLLIPLLDFFHPGLPITHDGQDHVARIANFYGNLKEGIMIPRWAQNLNWGYGHPILMFLYPLPSYISSVFHFLGLSLVDSVKLFFVLSFIASGGSMYLWLSRFLSREAAFVGALLYTYAPYRFVDMYVRGAIGEHAAFIFLPLVLYFLYRVFFKNSYFSVVGGACSVAGLLLSHNAISLMFFPLILLYSIYLFTQTKRKYLFISQCFLIIMLGFGLAAFFWIPAFFEGKYTLREIVTKKGYLSSFVTMQSLLFGDWNYGGNGQFSVQVGVLQWISVAISFPVSILLWKRKKHLGILNISFLIIFFISLLFMLPFSKIIWEKISILQKFQFTWRILSVSVFASAVLGGLVFSIIPEKKKYFFLIPIVLIILFLNKNYWHARSYLFKQESFYAGIYDGTTDTGESAPIWSVRFMEKRPKAHIEVINGISIIKELEYKITDHEYKMDVQKKSRVRENTLYFPGWSVYVDGQKSNIEFQDPANRGLITFYIPQGMHAVSIRFEETKLRLLADCISFLSLLCVAILVIVRKKIWRLYQ